MDEKQMNNSWSQQKEIAEILGFLESRGYTFSEREKGRIEQILIDSFWHRQAKDRLPNTT